jgi:hypothetical protein
LLRAELTSTPYTTTATINAVATISGVPVAANRSRHRAAIEPATIALRTITSVGVPAMR